MVYITKQRVLIFKKRTKCTNLLGKIAWHAQETDPDLYSKPEKRERGIWCKARGYVQWEVMKGFLIKEGA